jgi:hypothetical protein
MACGTEYLRAAVSIAQGMAEALPNVVSED